MPLSRFLPRKYSTRLMVMALISGLIPIIIFACLMNIFANRFPVETDRAIQQGQEEQWQRSGAVLRQMAQDFIRQKALDVALQLELYLEAHPGMTVEELQNDPEFRDVAVQPVGRTGYTAVQDSGTAINRFHKNPRIENLDLHSLADRLPEFWAIMAASLGGKYSHGYYRWKDSDGQIRDKFMYIAPLAEKTADGVRFGVAATTYIDEFTRSIQAAQDVSRSTTRYLMITLNRLIQSFTYMGLLFMGLGIVLVSGLSLWVGIYFSRAITGLREATRAVNQGDFAARVKTAMSGDVGELIEDFNRMVARLAETTVKKEQLEISEEKLRAINAELLESEEKYRTILETIEDGYYEVDIAGNHIFFNDSLFRILGYSRDEFTGMNYRHYTAPEDAKKVYQIFNRVYRTGKPSKGSNWEVAGKDGTKIHWEVSISLIRDSEGQTTGFRGIARDITERKKAEEALRQSEEKYRTILETIEDGYYEVDIAGNFTFFNDSLLRILGYSRDELMGVSYRYYTPPDDAKRVYQVYNQVYRTGKPDKGFDWDVIRKDGSKIHTENSVSLVRGSEDQPVGFRGIIRDMTKREQAKEALRYLKEYNEKIVAGIPSSLLVLDKDLKIKSVNRTYLETGGIKKEDVVGRNIKEVFPAHLLKEGGLLKAFEEVMETKEPRRLYSVRHTASRHPEKILNFTVSGIRLAEEEEEEEEEATLILIIEDVTERARLTEEIREKNEELENFVYIVSHDLKAPLISLQGFSSALLKDYQDKLGEEGERYVKRIKANTRRMEVLITDLLALSRLGRAVSVFKDVSSLEIANRAISSLKPQLKENGVEVSLRDNLPTIRCDGERIYQVFENLIVNAIKFMGDAQEPEIEIGYEKKEEVHQFYVRDNGIGIDPRYHGKIFEIFQRLKEVEDEKGTGIGLVIVERIIKNHGGKVWVESERGEGATFYFTLPKMPSQDDRPG